MQCLGDASRWWKISQHFKTPIGTVVALKPMVEWRREREATEGGDEAGKLLPGWGINGRSNNLKVGRCSSILISVVDVVAVAAPLCSSVCHPYMYCGICRLHAFGNRQAGVSAIYDCSCSLCRCMLALLPVIIML